jgi:hypothetical protein
MLSKEDFAVLIGRRIVSLIIFSSCNDWAIFLMIKKNGKAADSQSLDDMANQKEHLPS